MDSASAAQRLRVLNQVALESSICEPLSDIREPLPYPGRRSWTDESENVAESIFSAIRKRRFCYLSRKRSAVYRESGLVSFTKHIALQQPISFYYDIDGGYHAGVSEMSLSLNFEPGLGEVLIVVQISLLARTLAPFYSQVILFKLVIDNVCALRVNVTPLKKTEALIEKLQAIVQYMESPITLICLLTPSVSPKVTTIARSTPIGPINRSMPPL